MIPKDNHKYHTLFFWAAGSFILAAATGALLRFGLIYGLPFGWEMGNVRHAHSHLMYFGWVTPALMALMSARLPALTGRPLHPHLGKIIPAILVLGLAAYSSFLFYGYGMARIGGLSLPLSTISASLNMLAWYVFAWFYWQATRGVKRVRPLRFFDMALALLVLASLGAWGLAVLGMLRLDDLVWSQTLTHLFLNTFAEGWFVMGALAVLFAIHPIPDSRPLVWGENLLVIGLPVVFLLGMSPGLLPVNVRLIGGLGGLLASVGLLLVIYASWRPLPPVYRLPLFFLTLKAVTLLAVISPDVGRWVERSGLRVPYLHWLLLGFTTLALTAAAEYQWRGGISRAWRWLAGGVVFMLLTLMPMTSLWPRPLRLDNMYYLVMWATLVPTLLAVLWLVQWVSARGSSKPGR